MSKHTPGPWTVGTHLDEDTDLTRGEYVVFPVPEDEEAGGNARLIAAAPELLAACKESLNAIDCVLRAFETGCTQEDEAAQVRWAIRQIHEAINKATKEGA